MREVLYVLAAAFLTGCGGNSLPHTSDVNKPTQVVGLTGGVELQLDHTIGEIITQNHNARAVGVVLVDARDLGRRILGEPYVAGGHESMRGADLSPRNVLGTVYVYSDSFGGLAAKALATFGLDFEDHLDQRWVDSKQTTYFTIE